MVLNTYQHLYHFRNILVKVPILISFSSLRDKVARSKILRGYEDLKIFLD